MKQCQPNTPLNDDLDYAMQIENDSDHKFRSNNHNNLQTTQIKQILKSIATITQNQKSTSINYNSELKSSNAILS